MQNRTTREVPLKSILTESAARVAQNIQDHGKSQICHQKRYQKWYRHRPPHLLPPQLEVVTKHHIYEINLRFLVHDHEEEISHLI